MTTNDAGFSTRAIHGARHVRTSADRGEPVVPPIFQSASFHFASAEEQEQVSAGELPGYAYTRSTNPTLAALEATVADLEGAEGAVSFSSGIAAIHAAIASCVGAGEHVICTQHVYGGTYSLLTRTLARFGVSATFVDATDLAAIERAWRPETRVLWAETIANPATTVLDLPALAELAHRHGALLAVDSTLTSPVLSRPLALGADLVVHSATKYLGGHGDLLGGILAGSRERVHKARVIVGDVGGCASPIEAWLLQRGLKTLALRMERHCANALALAQYLTEQPGVARVWYPALPSHPQHALASRQFAGYGGLLSFEVEGGKAEAYRVLNRLTLPLRSASLGDAETLVSHPASISHRRLPPAQRVAAGVPENLIRVAVGLEDASDLLKDFGQALQE